MQDPVYIANPKTHFACNQITKPVFTYISSKWCIFTCDWSIVLNTPQNVIELIRCMHHLQLLTRSYLPKEAYWAAVANILN